MSNLSPFLLIASENSSINQHLKELLNDAYSIIESANTTELFEILTHQPVQLVIVDAVVKGESGIEICKKLRTHRRFFYLPVLLIIDEHDGQIAKEALEAGITNFLTHPLTKESVTTAILVACRYSNVMLEMTSSTQKLKKFAEHDALTNLYNRYVLYDHGRKEIDKALRGNLPLSLLLLDIDHFKKVNDEYGHLVGDEILIQLSSRISKAQRSYDLTVRFGGEEFIVLLSNTSTDQAFIVAEKIRKNIKDTPFLTSAGPITISISIGLSTLSSQKPTLEELIQEADNALYVAKQRGRNQVCTSTSCLL